DHMIAGKSLGILRSARTNQWSHPGSATDDFLRADGMSQVAIQVTEQVVYFIACGIQLVVNTYFLFGSAYEQPSIPGNCEQDAAIFGPRNQQGVVARQNFHRQQDMDPFAEAHAWRRAWGGHLSNCVCVRPSRVNKSARTHGEAVMRTMLLHFYCSYLSIQGFFKGGDAHVVQRLAACLGEGVHQRNIVASVVKLSVGVGNGTDQATGIERGNPAENFVAREERTGGEAGAAGNPIVELQSNLKIENAPPVKARCEEPLGFRQVRRVPEHVDSFVERASEDFVLLDVELAYGLFEVAYPAVDHLGGSARSGGGKIQRFQLHGSQIAKLCCESAAGPRGAAANHANIEGFILDALQGFRACLH